MPQDWRNALRDDVFAKNLDKLVVFESPKRSGGDIRVGQLGL